MQVYGLTFIGIGKLDSNGFPMWIELEFRDLAGVDTFQRLARKHLESVRQSPLVFVISSLAEF